MKKLIIFLIISFFSNKSFANTPSLENSTWKIFERGTTYDFNFSSGGNCTWGYVNLWYQTYSDCKWNQQGERFRISLNNDYNIMEGYLNGPNVKGRSVSKNTFYGPAEFSGYAVFIDKYIIKEVPKPRVEPKVENNKVTEKYSQPKITANDMTYAEAQRILGISPYGEDLTFLYVILFIFAFFIIFLVFKSSKNKKGPYKKSKKKITTEVYSQQNSFAFWHGRKGLALTFWGFFIGGNIFFNIITTLFLNNPTMAVLSLLISIVWTVLSTMGVFNAADIFKAEKIKQGSGYGQATAAKVACVLLILAGIGMNIPR